jgi:hypothetical protein
MKMMEVRAPDEKFFTLAEGPAFVRIDFSRLGGTREYAIVHSVVELATLVSKLPASARVSITQTQNITPDDVVYITNESGLAIKGSY